MTRTNAVQTIAPRVQAAAAAGPEPDPEGIILGLFGGPGGWAEALRKLGKSDVGIELDAAACATRRAAGHQVIRADVSTFPVEQLAGKVQGQVDSPPCVFFSAAGTRTTPGRNTSVSIASARHNGRNTATACGAAFSSATISGSAGDSRS